jgi:hypothetical protein
MSHQSRLIVAGIVAVALTAALPVHADQRHRNWNAGRHHGHGGNNTGAIIGGIMGLALGAAIAGSQPSPYAPPPGVYYYRPQPYYPNYYYYPPPPYVYYPPY